MNRKYSGFTLVEMLIVMVLYYLMAVGIVAGRFAINRANDVAHQNAADQLFTAVQSYLTDQREYPVLSGGIKAALESEGDLAEYLTIGEFRGGTNATYLYWISPGQDAALVCVSLGGQADRDGRGHYCTGNGFSSDTSGGPGSIESKEVDAGNFPKEGWCNISQWDNKENDFNSEKSSSSSDCSQSYSCETCASS